MRTSLKRAALLALGIASLVYARMMFMFIDDPEGPNLLVVVVMAVLISSLSLGAYALIPKSSRHKKTPMVFLLQALIAIGIWICIR
jgi:hypothetical protein